MYYHRDLPHWHPEDAALFVTWRLHGSKPRDCDRPRNSKLTAGQSFVLNDREWATTATGPRWLADERVARVVADALHHGEAVLKLYTLYAWVVMNNHVHILIDPKAPLPKITRSIKSYTARQANAILDRTGPFWLEESYDRWIRTEDEFQRTVSYIEQNPVAVGLCEKPEAWPWSSGSAGQEAYPTL